MPNALTVDLEPWTCFYGDVLQDRYLVERNLVDGTLRILNVLEDCAVTATFFSLGLIYDWFPFLLDEIKSRGHEIAFHGHSHAKLLGDSLRREIEKSRDFLDKYKVIGFRAPEMRISWGDLSVLDSTGFVYDSSTYGSSNSKVGGIVEVPVSTYPVRRKAPTFPRTLGHALREFEVPIGSGLFVAVLNPRSLLSAIKKINQEGLPAVLFIHPWQLAGLAEVRMSQLIRHPSKCLYLRRISEKKLRTILNMNEFASVRELLRDEGLI